MPTPPEAMVGMRMASATARVSVSRSRERGGTGLGLTIARELAEMLGGEIEIDSSPGRGATFILTIPTAPPVDVLDAAGPEPKMIQTHSLNQG